MIWKSRMVLTAPDPLLRSNSLHGIDFPLILMRGSPDGTVEPDRHRHETQDLAA